MIRRLNWIPVPQPLQAVSRVFDLKERLDWGEPALTILDVRDRSQFNTGHILGAIPMPVSEPLERVLNTLEFQRDLYIYGETDEQASEVAALLRERGYKNVSQIRGGLAAWKAVGYPVESMLRATVQ